MFLTANRRKKKQNPKKHLQIAILETSPVLFFSFFFFFFAKNCHGNEANDADCLLNAVGCWQSCSLSSTKTVERDPRLEWKRNLAALHYSNLWWELAESLWTTFKFTPELNKCLTGGGNRCGEWKRQRGIWFFPPKSKGGLLSCSFTGRLRKTERGTKAVDVCRSLFVLWLFFRQNLARV